VQSNSHGIPDCGADQRQRCAFDQQFAVGRGPCACHREYFIDPHVFKVAHNIDRQIAPLIRTDLDACVDGLTADSLSDAGDPTY